MVNLLEHQGNNQKLHCEDIPEIVLHQAEYLHKIN
jgi:hypothetical protein